jgi:DNA-binding CsgD family transcriptional regulator
MSFKKGPASRLTTKQKECLRLVGNNFSSKEIGLRLGISHHTVDQRLRFATKALGAATRFEAARMLHEAEPLAAQTPEHFVYQPPHVEPNPVHDTEGPSDAERDRAFGPSDRALQDAGNLTWPIPQSSAAWAFDAIPQTGGFRQPIRWQVKGLLAVAIALLSLIAFGAAIAGLEVLSRLN